MNRFRYWLQNFMTGRYGADNLNRFMLYLSFGLMIIQMFFGRKVRLISYFYPLALLLLMLCYFRMFSRNINKRYQENMKFLALKDRLTGKGDRTHRVYKCPGCGQKVRVPKGKGKISIHCPKCHQDFIRRT